MDPFALKKLVGALLLPPAGFLLVALLGLLLLGMTTDRRADDGRRSPRWLWRRIGGTLAVAGVAAALAVSAWPVASARATWLVEPYALLDPVGDRLPRLRAVDWRTVPATAPQAIVMLTAGSAPDGFASDRDERLAGDTLERALHAARVAKLTNLPILVSGGMVRPSRQTLAEMARDVIERDLGVRVRWLETQSRDTAENARYSARILQSAGVRRIVLVTHASHMRRAEALFRHQGFEVVPAPYGFMGKSIDTAWRVFWPTHDALDVSYVCAYEMLGLLWYGMTGWPSSTETR